MPRAVWQGFCSLLRGPPPSGTHSAACIAPTPGRSLGGHGASIRLPKDFHDGLRTPPRPQRCLQDSPRALQDAQDCPNTTQESTPKRAPRGPLEAPMNTSGGPQNALIGPQKGPKTAQEGPETAGEGPKTAPREPRGPSWGHLGRIGALLGCLGGLLVAWVGFLGRHGSLGELQGGAMAAQGAPGVWAMQAAICETEGGRALRRLQKPCQTALGILPRLNAQARWRI